MTVKLFTIVLSIFVGFTIVANAQKYDEKLNHLLSTNDLTGATKQLEKVYGNDKKSIEYIFLNGKLNRKKGNYTFAKECFHKVLEIDSVYANALDELGILELISNQDINACLVYLNKALLLKPNHPRILVNRGAAYFMDSQFDLAIKDYNTALKIDPEDHYCLYNLGLCYYELDKYQIAIDYFNKVLELQKNDPKAYFDRGKAYYYSGKIAEAKADFKKALKYRTTENRWETIPKEDIEDMLEYCK